MIPFIKNIAKAVVLLVAIGIVMANQEDRLQVIFEDEEDTCLSGKSVNVDIVTYNNLVLFLKFVACKYNINHLHDTEESLLQIRSPFISSEHPSEVETLPFFCGVSRDKLGRLLLIEDDDKVDSRIWDFSKNAERNLNYTIYLQHPNGCTDAKDSQDTQKSKLFSFYPYHEEKEAVYVLTWCRCSTAMGTPLINEQGIIFPMEDGSSPRMGVSVSPMLSMKSSDGFIDIEGSCNNVAVHFRLRHKVHDKEGNVWRLAWKKINKESLWEQGSGRGTGQNFPYAIDYFRRLSSYDKTAVLKRLSFMQKFMLLAAGSINSTSINKALLSNSPFIFLGEKSFENYRMFYYGIPDVERMAFVEAKVDSELSQIIQYKGYQKIDANQITYFLWSGIDCIYEGYDLSLPLVLNSTASNDESVKNLINYWRAKGYEFVSSQKSDGYIIYSFKQKLNWGYCIRVIFKNNTLKCIEAGTRRDSMPVKP